MANVAFAARSTLGGFLAGVHRQFQLHAAGAYPSTNLCRIPINESKIRNVARDHASGADKRVPADHNPAHDRAISPERSPAPYHGGAILVSAAHMAPRIHDVREDHRWSAEHIVFENATRIHGNIVLNFHVPAQNNIRRYDHVLTDVTVLSNPATLHDVGEMPNFGISADFAGFVDIRRFMDEVPLPAGAYGLRWHTHRATTLCGTCAS